MTPSWLRGVTAAVLCLLAGSLAAIVVASRQETTPRTGARLRALITMGGAAFAAAVVLGGDRTLPWRGAAAVAAALVIARNHRAIAIGGSGSRLMASASLAVFANIGVLWALRMSGADPRRSLLLAASWVAGGLVGDRAGRWLAANAASYRPRISLSPYAWFAACGGLLAAQLRWPRYAGGTDAVIGIALPAGATFQVTALASTVALPVGIGLLLEGARPTSSRERPPALQAGIAAALFASCFCLPLVRGGEHGTVLIGALVLAAALLVRFPSISMLASTAAVALAGAAVVIARSPRVQGRLLAFLEPSAPSAAVAQLERARWALRGSRFLGTGVGLGMPQSIYAPGDFALVGAAEELGAVGVAVYFVSLALLVAGTCATLAREGGAGPEPRAASVAMTLLLATFVPAVVSALVNLGALPVIGISAVLLTPSGSQLAATALALALSLRLAGVRP
jgi:cell division protein FtsW (lipid II flippase)